MATKLSLKTAQGTFGVRKGMVYNAIDCIATRQVLDVLKERSDAVTLRTYGMERSVQNPAFAMSLRGIPIDEPIRAVRCAELKREATTLVKRLSKNPQIVAIWDQLALASDPKVFGLKAAKCPKSTRKDGRHVWPRLADDDPAKVCQCCGMKRLKIAPFSATSPKQVAHLFYDLLGCKKEHNKDGGVSTDEECLGRVANKSKKAAPFVKAILDIRDLEKQVDLLEARLRGGRFHTSFNVGVTSTDRWSSNADAFHCGGNIQNVPERHRDIFISDPGKKLFYADLKQAESKSISYISGDEGYIKAHEHDTHTYVCHLIWPEGLNGHEWPADEAEWAKFAKGFRPEWDDVEGHDYRFQSKAVQHGSNLGLTVFGLALQKHIPVKAAADGQSRYFRAFPGIRNWQQNIRVTVENQEPIYNPLGVRFRLFGRPWDEHTYKQGLAMQPQSTVSNVINFAAEQIFHELDPWRVQLLAQAHDALVGQVDEQDDEALRLVYNLMMIPIPVTDIAGKTRVMTIEPEIAWGYNWKHGNLDPKKGPLNPRGLFDFHV